MTGALWTAATAAHATGGRLSGDWTATGVSIDSRTVAPGELFVALAGPTFDAHDFVADALTKGAAAGLVSRRPDGLAADAPLLVVDDTLQALNAMAGAARRQSGAAIAAITGSVGKTGTKEALKLVLAGQGETHASVSSYNNHWGVPLSLARMVPETAFGIFEIGMNHAGEITPLSRLVRPHVALITNVEAVHLAYFPSVEAIAAAKAEIFAGVQPGGSAVLNRDNPSFDQLTRAARDAGIDQVIAFGGHDTADARLVGLDLFTDHSRVDAEIVGQPISFTLGVPGRHWAINALGLLATVLALGADVPAAAAALAGMTAPKGRGRRHRVALAHGTFELIDESYNASPVAIRAALESFAALNPGPGGRRLAVLGDMRELGPAADRLHAELAADLAAAKVDLAYLAGPHMAALYDALPPATRGAWVDQSSELPPLLAAAVRPGDVVLVKGSLGSRMGPVVDALLDVRAGATATAANG